MLLAARRYQTLLLAAPCSFQKGGIRPKLLAAKAATCAVIAGAAGSIRPRDVLPRNRRQFDPRAPRPPPVVCTDKATLEYKAAEKALLAKDTKTKREKYTKATHKLGMVYF